MITMSNNDNDNNDNDNANNNTNNDDDDDNNNHNDVDDDDNHTHNDNNEWRRRRVGLSRFGVPGAKEWRQADRTAHTNANECDILICYTYVLQGHQLKHVNFYLLKQATQTNQQSSI